MQVLLQQRKTVFNIFNNPLFVSASDWWLDTFSLRSRMLLMSKVTSIVLNGGNYYSLRYHGTVGRLTVVAQQILKENGANMKKIYKKNHSQIRESLSTSGGPVKILRNKSHSYFLLSQYFLFVKHHLSTFDYAFI